MFVAAFGVAYSLGIVLRLLGQETGSEGACKGVKNAGTYAGLFRGLGEY